MPATGRSVGRRASNGVSTAGAVPFSMAASVALGASIAPGGPRTGLLLRFGRQGDGARTGVGGGLTDPISTESCRGRHGRSEGPSLPNVTRTRVAPARRSRSLAAVQAELRISTRGPRFEWLTTYGPVESGCVLRGPGRRSNRGTFAQVTQGAACGNRTHDLRITSASLWPTDLRRHAPSQRH